MGNRSNYHIISSFNPACCLWPPTIKKATPGRSSIDDDYDDGAGTCSSSYTSAHLQKTDTPLSVADEPSSPKVGCMGQIKRGKESSLSWSLYRPTTAKGHYKLLKLGRMLSGRSMSSMRASSRVGDDRSMPCVSVADMDPPLPVMRDAGRDANPVSLWKRRCGGHVLEGLQLQRQDYEGWGTLLSSRSKQ